MILQWHTSKIALQAVFVAYLVSVAGPSSGNEGAKERSDRPVHSTAAQDAQMRSLTETIIERPDAIDTLRKRADLYADRAQFQLAVQDLTAAIARDPVVRKQHMGIFVRRAQFNERLGKYAE